LRFRHFFVIVIIIVLENKPVYAVVAVWLFASRSLSEIDDVTQSQAVVLIPRPHWSSVNNCRPTACYFVRCKYRL